VLAWLRIADDGSPPVAVISNFTPVARSGYRIGLPHAGRWREILNTDADIYGGSGQGNAGQVTATDQTSHGFDASAEMIVPPLATLYLQWEPD
jgi:1,4-alpha-glucan branching enzyme